MGSSISRWLYDFADRIAMKSEKNDNARKEMLWRKYPEIRKLVPVPRCPNCKCRLNCKDRDDSDSEPEVTTKLETGIKVNTQSPDVERNDNLESTNNLKSEDALVDVDDSDFDLEFGEKDILNNFHSKIAETGEVIEGSTCF